MAEALHGDPVAPLVVEQDLERDDPIHGELAGLVDGPHAPFAELLDDLEPVIDDRVEQSVR